MEERVTVPRLQQMKQDGQKIVGIVAWDYPMAQIADRAGVEIVSVGDSVGVNLWGQSSLLEVTLEQMVTVTQAVRRGTKRALVSCDLPYGPVQEGVDAALKASIRMVKEAGVDMIKLDGAAGNPGAVTRLTQAGIPVWAQFGITPQTALHYGVDYATMSRGNVEVPPEIKDRLVSEARMLEAAGAALLDFTNSGPIVGPEVTRSVSIPVIGGFGGGPWLDGRVRLGHAAIGYGARYLDEEVNTYANVSSMILDAITAFGDDVRAARQIKGAPPSRG